MSKSIPIGALLAVVALALQPAAGADSGHEVHSEGGHSGMHGGHGASAPQPADLAGAWTALLAARDAIAADVESGDLDAVHAAAEPLPERVAALLAQSGELAADKRVRVEGAAKQVARVGDALHVAADRGDAGQTRKELSRLDKLLELIRAQYPAGALDGGGDPHAGHASTTAHAAGTHTHAARPAGMVDAPPRDALHIRTFDSLRFEPARLEVRAGVATRFELENAGSAEHSFVVKTPDGKRDWVHLHVAPGATEAATYQLDVPGTYPILCTIPGHTEGGMTGTLLVSSASLP